MSSQTRRNEKFKSQDLQEMTGQSISMSYSLAKMEYIRRGLSSGRLKELGI